jgi:hypothetical protein
VCCKNEGTKRKAGRPPIAEERRQGRFTFRATDNEYDKIKEKAARFFMPVNEFLLFAADKLEE